MQATGSSAGGTWAAATPNPARRWNPRQRCNPTRLRSAGGCCARNGGQGYAPEGARALLQYAFGTVGLQRAWAETMAVNTPSRRVMEKIGMRHIRTEVRHWDDPLPGAELGEVVYEITGEEWERRAMLRPDRT
ncbi:GNAT family N-acetyltransferase [Brevibacterium sp. 50QC2O2]|uniref:GNAT family N-acetyltransferase n=1 Tax=Brevibacterium TaxID=1696 RepID=UPI00211C6ADF|nr:MULTISPECIES: GNAT family protein [unclassified Brevibacterium]MCQ9384682.1 GNAT family N-acetyltransferase [Brevibacterium sp. 68QC2CO]MCQ9389268.1 GNAT family N-acetyltransferase [Brevibacterium sp. 50QC2O2]